MTPILERSQTMRTLRVSQGLFVLRYAASKAGLNAPTLDVHAAPSSGVDLIWPGSSTEGRLVSPGDAMVVRAARDSLVTLSVTPSHRNGSCDAELVLERVSTTLHHTATSTPQTGVAALRRPSSLEDIEILAHVSRRGDVLVPGGTWICGPDLPMAIEGLEIRWPNRPRDLDIVARPTVNARGLKTLAEQSIGSFVGTRGKAAPITSLALALTGSCADDYVLNCEALFLGLPVVAVSGQSCTLRGPTGLEPLVGLKLSVAAAEERAVLRTVGVIHNQMAEAPAPRLAAPRAESPRRVRIFRTSQKMSTLTA